MKYNTFNQKSYLYRLDLGVHSNDKIFLGGVRMLIKEFASKYKLTNDTVRYYEKEGLLAPVRQENGYRTYDQACERSIKFVLVLKQLGFSLLEIKTLLSLEKRPITNDCNLATTTLFHEKILFLERKIEFFSTAIQALQISHDLMDQGKYSENKSEIERLILDMYRKINERNEQIE